MPSLTFGPVFFDFCVIRLAQTASHICLTLLKLSKSYYGRKNGLRSVLGFRSVQISHLGSTARHKGVEQFLGVTI